MRQKNIILIGYRGTGKTSVGKKISATLKMPFYDTDDLVKKNVSRTIAQIVSESGLGNVPRTGKECHFGPFHGRRVVRSPRAEGPSWTGKTLPAWVKMESLSLAHCRYPVDLRPAE